MDFFPDYSLPAPGYTSLQPAAGGIGFQAPAGYGSMGAWGSGPSLLDAGTQFAGANIVPPVVPQLTAPQSIDWLSREAMFGGTDPATGVRTGGWTNLALGGAQALMSGFMGMQQYRLAKQQLAEGKRQFDQNYAAQLQTLNTQLEDRQRARVASNPGAYQSVGDYMTNNRIR